MRLLRSISAAASDRIRLAPGGEGARGGRPRRRDHARRQHRQGTDIPLATGEHEYTKFGVRDLILSNAADIVQADGARAGGYTEMLKIAALTQSWNLKFAPHAMENIHIHLVSAVPNALFPERLLMFEEITARVFKHVPVPQDGYITIPELPGLGLELDLDYIRSADEG